MTNKLRNCFLTAFVILVPLCYKPIFSREAQETFFQLMSMGMVAFFVGNIWLGAFLVLNVLLFVNSGGVVGSSQILNVMLGCLIFMFSRYHFSKNKFDVVYKPMLVVLLINLLWMMMQIFRIDPLFQPISNGGELTPGPLSDPSGFFGIKEASGTFIALCAPILASMNPIITVLLIIPIILCKSSAVYLAVAVGTLFYTFYLYKRIFKILCMVMPILALVFIIKDFKDDSKTFTSRFPAWHATARYCILNPIGYGPDSYRHFNKHKDFKFLSDSKYNLFIEKKISQEESHFIFYSVSRDPVEVVEGTHRLLRDGIKKDEFSWWDNPHNQILNMFFQYGILGFLLLLGFMNEIRLRFKHAIKDKEMIVISSCLLVYFVTGMIHFPLELARTAFFFPILLGAYYAKTDEV